VNEKNIFFKQLDKLEVGGGITNGSEHERKRKNPDRNQTANN
jgi:hypothetical protein